MTSRHLVALGAVFAAAYLVTFVVPMPAALAVTIKTASTLALAGAAVLGRGAGSRLLTVAVLFHVAGDALIEVAPLPAAMGAFLVGHLLYCAIFLRWRRGWSALPAGRRILAAALVAVCAVLVCVVVPHAGPLAVPVSLYALAILAMSLAATFAAAPNALAVGAASYVVSDAVLATTLFVQPFAGSAFVTWPTYWIGQALIVTAALARLDADTPSTRRVSSAA